MATEVKLVKRDSVFEPCSLLVEFRCLLLNKHFSELMKRRGSSALLVRRLKDRSVHVDAFENRSYERLRTWIRIVNERPEYESQE